LLFISLFAGIGGLDLGFQRAGMQCVGYAEIDQKASAVMALRFPGVPNLGDVRNVTKETAATPDVVCGGFPCQDLSVAGKRAGLAGERSGLWFEFHRVLAELRPQWAVIENVPGLLSSRGGRDFAVILRGLAEIGYLSAWRVLDAQYYGVAQRRRRVFIVASLGDGRAAQVLFERQSLSWDTAPSRETGEGVARNAQDSIGFDSEPNATREMMGTIRSHQSGGSELFTFQNTGHGWWNESPVSQTLRTPGGGGSLEANVVAHTQWGDVAGTLSRRHDSSPCADRGQNVVAIRKSGRDCDTRPGRQGTTTQEDVMYTLQAEQQHAVVYGVSENQRAELKLTPYARQITTGGGKPGQGYPAAMTQFGVRRLTPTECERLQGFPDGWTDNGQSDSARYRQLGNAVCVPVAEWIGRQIIRAERYNV
jgi:DNA (cytosine-5)-methyltransferase 1